MIAVTGALGFIGSRILLDLLKRQPAASLLAVDHPLRNEKRVNVVNGVRFLDHQAFLEALARGESAPGIIIHMGACSSTTETDWNFLRANNLEYSQTLWQWCAANRRRLIYASSAATYGDGSDGFDDEADIGRLKPLNLYGKSKQDFDLWVRDQQRLPAPKPPQCAGFKFFNVFGPGESHKARMASMVYHSYHQIRDNGRVKLFKSHRPDYTDGGQLRDFIYVGQVVSMILQCVDNPAISGLFNLGTGEARSFRELSEAVFAALKLDPAIDYIPMPEDLQGKYQYFTQATMAKAARAGLRLPKLSLEEAVAEYVGEMRAVETQAASPTCNPVLARA